MSVCLIWLFFTGKLKKREIALVKLTPKPCFPQSPSDGQSDKVGYKVASLLKTKNEMYETK